MTFVLYVCIYVCMHVCTRVRNEGCGDEMKLFFHLHFVIFDEKIVKITGRREFVALSKVLGGAGTFLQEGPCRGVG